MSALTKVFVVLLVVLSLLLTAGTVVFVNRVEDFRASAATMETRLAAAENDLLAAQNASVAASANAKVLVNQANQQIESIRQDLARTQQASAELRNQLTALTAQHNLQGLALSQSTEGLKASEDQKARLLTEVAQLRTQTNDLVRKSTDLNQTIADLTARLEQTERARRTFVEQLTEAQNQAETYRKALADAGIDLRTAAQTAGLTRGAPDLRGVVQSTTTVGGVPYATISLGSSDAVQPGMEFKVIDRQNARFLGILTVEQVDANEAVGRLTGPAVDAVRQGAEVRTQL